MYLSDADLRRAEEIMQRHGWTPIRGPAGWCAAEAMQEVGEYGQWMWAGFGLLKAGKILHLPPVNPTPTPFECIIAAEEWLEKNQCADLRTATSE